MRPRVRGRRDRGLPGRYVSRVGWVRRLRQQGLLSVVYGVLMSMSDAPEMIWLLGSPKFRPWKGFQVSAYEAVPPWADDEPNLNAYRRADLAHLPAELVAKLADAALIAQRLDANLIECHVLTRTDIEEIERLHFALRDVCAALEQKP